MTHNVLYGRLNSALFVIYGQVLTPMLRCLGNVICSGLDETAAAACEKKALFPTLGRLLASEHQHIRKECLWVLSNVTGIICLIKRVVSLVYDTGFPRLLQSPGILFIKFSGPGKSWKYKCMVLESHGIC